MPEILDGDGKSWMDYNNLAGGLYPVGVMSKPVNSIVSSAKRNLSGLKTIPLSAQSSMYDKVCQNDEEMSSAHNSESSMHIQLHKGIQK